MGRRKIVIPDGVVTDRKRRRVTCPFPIPLDAMTALCAHAQAVIGKDAVMDARVSPRIGAAAFCAPGDGDVWLAELDGAQATGGDS